MSLIHSSRNGLNKLNGVDMLLDLDEVAVHGGVDTEDAVERFSDALDGLLRENLLAEGSVYTYGPMDGIKSREGATG